jgi:hypothetical protein
VRRLSMKQSQGHSPRATRRPRCRILTSMMRRAAGSNRPMSPLKVNLIADSKERLDGVDNVRRNNPLPNRLSQTT